MPRPPLLLPGPEWPTFDFFQPSTAHAWPDTLSACAAVPSLRQPFCIGGAPLYLKATTETDPTNDPHQPATQPVDHTALTSTVVWDCSIVLAKFLEYQCERLVSLRNRRVLELGSGQGLVGLAAARLGATVTLTDVEFAIPALTAITQLNELSRASSVNHQSANTSGGCIESVQPLDWCTIEKNQDQFTGHPVDYIVAADVVWVDWLIEPLVNTIHTLSHQSYQRHGVAPLTYLCHQSRSSRGDRLLTEAFTRHGLAWRTLPDGDLDPLFRKPGVIAIYELRLSDAK
ncbi:hypothetical protein H4R35_004266 [Dimargaris xerosporica]|nr:hypothetical protein H4R35_004266 [Dimargaris xerosporica]